MGSQSRGDKYAWYYLSCFASVVSGGRSTDMESQPLLGLLSERWNGFASGRCSYFVVARPDLVRVRRDI